MDLERLQGIWQYGGATLTISGDRFTTAQLGASHGGHIEIHPEATPKTITLHYETGPEAGHVRYGIYEFIGEEWHFCLNTTGGPAPREFAASALRGIVFETMRRREAPAPPLFDAPVEEMQGEWIMTSCVRGGETLPRSFVRQGRRVIAGNQFVLYFGPQLVMQGVLSRDGAGTFRLEFTSGEEPQLGIFERHGDELRTCVGRFGQPRPLAFSSSPAGGETFSVWKRVQTGGQ
jgi:uncharacterized protein (TIGR03067 family)